MRFAGLLDWLRATGRADRVGIAVIAVVVLVSAGFVVAGRVHPAGTDSRTELDRIGDKLDAANPWDPHAEATDGGTVTVLEQGFARLPKSRDNANPKYAVGFVLENTSRTDAVIPNINLTVRDANGDEVTDVDATGELDNETIPPGARIGVADTLSPPESISVTVAVGRSEWYSARPDIGAIETTRVGPHGRTGLSADVESDYDTAMLTPTFYVLFRDFAGELLGGQPISAWDHDDSVPPGKSRHEFTFNHPPPTDADMDATELHVVYDRTVISF